MPRRRPLRLSRQLGREQLLLLKRNARALDHLIVEWLHVIGPGVCCCVMHRSQEALVNGWLRANAPQLKVLPLVNNYDEAHSRWDPAAAEAVLGSASARAQFASDIDRFVTGGHYAGVVLDLEQIPIDAQSDYVKLVDELAGIFRGRGLQLLVALAPDSTGYDYAGLAAAADGADLDELRRAHRNRRPGATGQPGLVRNRSGPASQRALPPTS